MIHLRLTAEGIAAVLRRQDGKDLHRWALVAAGIGLIPLVPAMPAAIAAPALFAFVLVGPGAAVFGWLPPLPGQLLAGLIPLIGCCTVILVNTAAVFAGWWHPKLLLLLLVLATAASAGLAFRPPRGINLPAPGPEVAA